MAIGAGLGSSPFRPEYGLYTFGPAWIVAVLLYLRQTRKAFASSETSERLYQARSS